MQIAISCDVADLPHLQKLPWHKSLEDWTKRDARFLQVRKGLSRHVVRFVSLKGRSFAIKETSAGTAKKEYNAYVRLQARGIPCLTPVATVVRNEGSMAVATLSGLQSEPISTGYIVTGLLEFALPNYHLFRRAFNKKNRRRIWDAIVRLFVQLHCNGVYWGDATLSNMMILFVKQTYPEIGIRTILRAVLADAETVEFYPFISQSLRNADVDYFLESMLWTEADMKASGIIREPLMTAGDQEYILNRYRDLYEIEQEEDSFELITKIDVDALLGPFEMKGQSKALLQHIYEHKWYLSESKRKEVPVEDAARDWYKNIFKPVLQLFNESKILDEFPERTAASLYLDVMLQKYYLSEKLGRDVGLAGAFEEYLKEFHPNDRALRKMARLARSIRKLLVDQALVV
jgi:hypothetical protein